MTLNAKQVAALDLLEQGEEYAAYFFKKATGLVWFDALRERGHFDPSRNPKPKEAREKGFFTIPQWPALDYLERISHDAAKPENRDYAEKLMGVIRSVTRPADAGHRADNYRTWWYFTKILCILPTEVISTEDIDMFRDWLHSAFDTTLVGSEIGRSLLPRLLGSTNEDDWWKAARLVEIATEIRWVERRYQNETVDQEPRTAVDGHWLREMFAKNATTLGVKCGRQTIEVLRARLAEVVAREGEDEYSYIWRPAIESHGQNQDFRRLRGILVSALRDVALSYAKAAARETSMLAIRMLLSDDLQIVRRLGLYVVNETYENHGELFWEVLNIELFATNYTHELYMLLEKRFKQFSPQGQERVIALIEGLSAEDREGIDRELLTRSIRLKWLHAIKGNGNQHADHLYDEYLKTVKYVPEHPEFASYVKSGFVGEVSPISSEKILSMDVPSIVTYLREFEGPGGWRAPSEQGLADALRSAVKQDPGKFEEQLGAFADVGVPYLHAILSAFEELSGEKKPVNWKRILEFCLSVVESERFWAEPDQEAGSA